MDETKKKKRKVVVLCTTPSSVDEYSTASSASSASSTEGSRSDSSSGSDNDNDNTSTALYTYRRSGYNACGGQCGNDKCTSVFEKPSMLSRHLKIGHVACKVPNCPYFGSMSHLRRHIKSKHKDLTILSDDGANREWGIPPIHTTKKLSMPVRYKEDFGLDPRIFSIQKDRVRNNLDNDLKQNLVRTSIRDRIKKDSNTLNQEIHDITILKLNRFFERTYNTSRRCDYEGFILIKAMTLVKFSMDSLSEDRKDNTKSHYYANISSEYATLDNLQLVPIFMNCPKNMSHPIMVHDRDTNKDLVLHTVLKKRAFFVNDYKTYRSRERIQEHVQYLCEYYAKENKSKKKTTYYTSVKNNQRKDFKKKEKAQKKKEKGKKKLTDLDLYYLNLDILPIRVLYDAMMTQLLLQGFRAHDNGVYFDPSGYEHNALQPSLQRKDNKKGHVPGNCVWATAGSNCSDFSSKASYGDMLGISTEEIKEAWLVGFGLKEEYEFHRPQWHIEDTSVPTPPQAVVDVTIMDTDTEEIIPAPQEEVDVTIMDTDTEETIPAPPDTNKGMASWKWSANMPKAERMKHAHEIMLELYPTNPFLHKKIF